MSKPDDQILFRRTKDDTAIRDYLSPAPRVRSALVIKLFSDDVGCHEFQLVGHRGVGHCDVEDEYAGGFLHGSL